MRRGRFTVRMRSPEYLSPSQHGQAEHFQLWPTDQVVLLVTTHRPAAWQPGISYALGFHVPSRHFLLQPLPSRFVRPYGILEGRLFDFV